MRKLVCILLFFPLSLFAETKFELHLVKDTLAQRDLWKSSLWMIDIDKLVLQETPILSSSDILALSRNAYIEDGLILLLKTPTKVSAGPAGLNFFVISINNERVLLGQFISPISSVRRPGVISTMTEFDGTISEVNIPTTCKELNTFLRKLKIETSNQKLQPTPLNAGDEIKVQGGAAEL